MNIRFIRIVGALAALLMATGASGASVIFSQTPTIDGISLSDADASFNQADDFSLLTSATLTSVKWRGAYVPDDSPPATDDFTITVYTDSLGLPGTLVQSFAIGNPDSRVDTGSTVSSGFSVYEYEADLGAGVFLTSGNTYWLSIQADTDNDLNDNWFWGMDNGVGASAFDNGDDGIWGASGSTRYFVLSGTTVPIPAPVWLFGSALALLGWIRRRTA